MNRTDAPAKQSVPFGVNGQREAILPTTPAGDNTASYDVGFPPITMILKSAGGLPPKGQDINQILFELSSLGRWASTGALNTFDASFASSIGGYPAGSYVLGDDLKTVYRCTLNGNSANPNSVTTGWAKVAQDIADILSLGTAAYRNIGTGTNQIPDMSSWTSGGYSNSTIDFAYWRKFPDGTIVQSGCYSTGTSGANIFYPTPFPSRFDSVTVAPTGNLASANMPSVGIALAPSAGTKLTTFTATGYATSTTSGTSSLTNIIFYWTAVGR